MAPFTELSLFSGAGGGLLATQHLLGWQTVCYVENESYCVDVLKARIQDGIFDDAPIWDDVRTFDGRPWRGTVDCITAGFPCTPFSCAGKRKGKADKRNLWPDTVRIIDQVRPEWCLLENSSELRCPRREKNHATPAEAGYLGQVLGDLAGLGFDGRWGVLSARAVGANHIRRRLWLVAHAHVERCDTGRQHQVLPGQSFSDPVVAALADPNGQGEPQQGQLLRQVRRRAGDGVEETTDTNLLDADGGGRNPGDVRRKFLAATELSGGKGPGWWQRRPAEPGVS